MRRFIPILLVAFWCLAGVPALVAQENDSYFNNFSTGNTEFARIPEGLAQLSINDNEELEIALNKQAWWFFQDFYGNEPGLNLCQYPYVSFRLKTSDVASTTWRVNIKSVGGTDGISAGNVSHTIVGDGNFATYTFDFTEVFANAPDGFGCSRIREIQIDPGGFQPPGNVIEGLFVMDDYAVGRAAFPESHFFPTLNPIDNLALTPDDISSAVSVPLDGISDGDGGSQNLTITATSDNQELLPDDNISVEGPNGSLATLNLDFVPAAFGTAGVTVTVTDDGAPPLSTSQSFEALVFNNKGYATDYTGFNEEEYWSAPKFYTYRQEDNQMKLFLNKGQAEVVFGVFELPVVLDISENPVLMIKANTTRDVNFDVRLVDTADAASNVIRRTIRSVSDFVWYEYDFAGAGIGLSQVKAVEFIPNGWQLAGTNRTTTYDGALFLDELIIGEGAMPTGLHFNAITNQRTYINAGRKEVLVSDLSSNITTVHVISDNTTLIPADSISATFNGSVAAISYHPAADEKGTANVTFEVSDGAHIRSQAFTIEVAGNNAPTVTPPAALEIKAGESVQLALRDIDDGNPEAAQAVSVSLTSSDEAILPHPDVLSESGDAVFEQDERSGQVTLSPPPGASGPVTVAVNLSDGEGTEEMSSSETFVVHVFEELNAPPTADPVLPQQVFVNEPAEIVLSGITDGADNTENLTVEVSSSDPSIIEGTDFTAGPLADGQAVLTFTPPNTGVVDITVTITDDGGEPGVNNGDQSVSVTFPLDIIPEPITGEVAVFEDSRWSIDTDDGSSYEIVDDGEGGLAWKATFTGNKRNWNGHAYALANELNLTNYPYITFEAKVERDGGPANSNYKVYFWDVDNRYTTGAPNDVVTQTVPADGQWHRVTADYTGNMVSGAAQEPLNVARIKLIHFHIEGGTAGATSPWVAGDYYIRDLRIGSEVTELAGVNQVIASIDAVGKQWASVDETSREVLLTGIRSGNDNAPAITVTGNTNPALGTVELSPVANRQATLTFTPSGNAGSTTVTVEVNGEGVDIPATAEIDIIVADPAEMEQALITFDETVGRQTIQGMGAFYDRSGALAPEAAGDMGLSIIRVEIEPEFEPQNDNDDPSVVNFDALDFDYIFPGIERYKEAFERAGVDGWKVIATAWSPPYWMKENLSEAGGPSNSAPTWEGTDNRVRPELYEEYAEFLAAWWLAVKAKTGVEVYAICPQNEPAYSQFYNSAILSPEKFADVVAVVGPKFNELGVTAKIFMPEQNFEQGVNGYSMVAYMEALKAHPTAAPYVDIIATHGYASDGIGVGNLGGGQWVTMRNNARNFTAAQGGGKELWMTETSGEPDDFQEGAMAVAGAIGLGLSKGEAQGWVYWTLQSGADEQGARFGYYRGARKTVKYHAAKHYYRFLRPGARMFSAASDNDALIVNAGQNPDGSTAIVIVNMGDSPIAAQWGAGGNIPENLTVYQSVENSYVLESEPFGKDRLVLPPSSITSIVAGALSGSVAFTADDIPGQEAISDGSSYSVNVTGISYEGSSEGVSIAVYSSDGSIIPAPEVSDISDGTATITYTPVEDTEGIVTMEVRLYNGLAGIVRSFDVEVTPVTGISPLKAAGIEVYPVPAGKTLYISSGQRIGNLRLISMDGSEVYAKNVNANYHELDVSELPQGVYLLQLEVEGKAVSGKVFVQ